MFKKLLEETIDQNEKEAWFEERTGNHIALVQKYAKMLADANPEFKEFWANKLLDNVAKHDASKLEEPERTPYIALTWKHKNDDWKSYKTPGTISDKEINDATMHHILNNEHHPEYWNKEEANLDPANRDKSTRVMDASNMPPVALAEMVADWAAMSEELKKNTAREWFNKQKDVRWHFSDEQVDLIDRMLKVIEKGEQ